MSIVVDASVTMSWYFRDEMTPETSDVLDSVAENGAVVPPLWRLEIINSFEKGIKRKRVDISYRNKSLHDLSALKVTIDDYCDQYVWNTTLRLVDHFGLTIYDACYLELAQRYHLPLATLDKELRAAAHTLGIPLRGM